MDLVVAHLSDFHVSRYGEHVTSLRGRKLRSKLGKPGGDWEELRAVDGWRIEQRPRHGWRRRAEPKGWDLRLLDEAGYVQEERTAPVGGEAQAREALFRLVEERHRTEQSRLAASFPDAAEVEKLLEDDPHNTNLLFHRVARAVRADKPDWLVVTGDLTDDGVGYELVASWLAPFVERGRLLAIPGNHDVYDSPALVVPAHERKNRNEKRALWGAFAGAVGMPAIAPWTRDLGGGVTMSALDSCIPPLTPLSASGKVTVRALDTLEAQLRAAPANGCRLAMLHHHVVNAPLQSVNAAPWQLGMRLRNASTVFEWLRAQGFQACFNGHRHLGYRFHPAHAPLFVSAPSATLGCRSGAKPFYWRMDIKDGEITSVRERPIRA